MFWNYYLNLFLVLSGLCVTACAICNLSSLITIIKKDNTFKYFLEKPTLEMSIFKDEMQHGVVKNLIIQN